MRDPDPNQILLVAAGTAMVLALTAVMFLAADPIRALLGWPTYR